MAYGGRILTLFLVMFPQIALGAYITFSHRDLYNVYASAVASGPSRHIPTRFWEGLITWIPAAMMSVLGILVVLRLWRRQETANERHPLRMRTAAGTFTLLTWGAIP